MRIIRIVWAYLKGWLEAVIGPVIVFAILSLFLPFEGTKKINIIWFALLGYPVGTVIGIFLIKVKKVLISGTKAMPFWQLVGYAIPRQARKEIYENLIDEVKIDWIEANAACDSPFRLGIVKIALGFRVFWYFASTLAVVARGALAKAVFGLWRLFGN